jgi:hypothetical protein
VLRHVDELAAGINALQLDSLWHNIALERLTLQHSNSTIRLLSSWHKES